MNARVHLHLHVSDLAKSREFYEKFLGTGPAKVKEGYVKFLPEWAPVNAVREEMGVDCCHANQDKFYDLEGEVTAPRPLGLPLAKSGGVCCSLW